jgi:peroxiredoxin
MFRSIASVHAAVRIRPGILPVIVAVLLAAALPSLGAETARFGNPFPAGTFDNFNVQAGGPASINLADYLGKKPVLLYYWVAGNERADAMFTAIQDLAQELGPDRVALFGVALERPGREAPVIKKRLEELGIRVPVLNDQVFKLGTLLRVQSVPDLTIIDAAGILRLSNGGSLQQEIEYKMNLADAVRRVAEKGTLGTYGPLQRYEPITEFVGKKAPDFEATPLAGGQTMRWHDMLSRERLNVLIFWSVNCPHCKQLMPEIGAWVREHPGELNIVAVAPAESEATRVKTLEFIKANDLPFPTMVDEDDSIWKTYEIRSTPTVLAVRTDGVVDSIMISATQDFGRFIEETHRAPGKGP